MDPQYLLNQARKCRNLAATTMDKRVAATLRGMAMEYDQKAQLILARQKPGDQVKAD